MSAVILARALDGVRSRLATAVRVEEPFPHVFIDNLFPDEVYAILADAWPSLEFFWTDRPERHDLVPKPPGTSPKDARADAYERMPHHLREVWDFFVIDINRLVIGPFLLEMFKPEITARLELLAAEQASGTELPRFLRPPFHPQMNVGRLMIRGFGYRLRPHVDALAYLATALYYFPQPGESDTLGTTLYRADRELDPAGIVAREKTVYFREAGIDVQPVAEIPFIPNALLAFANTGRSAHGMHITEEGVRRRAYQSHLSLKGDRDHL